MSSDDVEVIEIRFWTDDLKVIREYARESGKHLEREVHVAILNHFDRLIRGGRDVEHGTADGWVMGCRCERCKAGWAATRNANGLRAKREQMRSSKHATRGNREWTEAEDAELWNGSALEVALRLGRTKAAVTGRRARLRKAARR